MTMTTSHKKLYTAYKVGKFYVLLKTCKLSAVSNQIQRPHTKKCTHPTVLQWAQHVSFWTGKMVENLYN